mgnify:CR=1 FL=1
MNEYLVEAEELHAHTARGETFVIDTRDPQAYAAGHLPNAVNVHDIFTYLCTRGSGGHPAMVQHFAKVFGAAGLQRTDRVVVYEDAMDNGYGQSCRGWFLLNYLGHPEVRVLHGGLKAWQAAKLPLTTEVPLYERARYEPVVNEGLMVTADEMVAAIRNSEIKIVDVRDYAEWLAANSSPYGYDYCPRKGRIPRSLWLEWYKLMTRKGGVPWFRTPEVIRTLAEAAGLNVEDQLYLYCFKGARTSNAMLALKLAGFKNVRNYFNSWNEWSRDFSLPIEEGYSDEAPA